MRQYFSLYRAVSRREGERRERIDESKNVQTTPTLNYCKRNSPLPDCNQNCRTPRHWKDSKRGDSKISRCENRLEIANIIAGQNAFAWDMINSSYLPRSVIVAFVESSALRGSYQKNPFHFRHFDLKRLSVLVNGVSTSGAPIHADFDVSGSHGAVTVC